MSDDLNAAFAQVRQAYHLLYAYHRRVRDLLGSLHREVSTKRFAFRSWGPALFPEPPAAKSAWFEGSNQTWQLMPGYATYAHWRRAAGARSWHVRVEIVTDTAFDEGASVGEPDPEDWNKSAGDSVIRLILVEVHGSERLDWYKRKDWFWDFDGAEWGDIREHTVDGISCFVIAYEVSLSDLPDNQAIEDRLMAPLRSWCESSF